MGERAQPKSVCVCVCNKPPGKEINVFSIERINSVGADQKLIPDIQPQ